MNAREEKYLKSMCDVVTEFFLTSDYIFSGDQKMHDILCKSEALSVAISDVLGKSSCEVHEELEEAGVNPYKTLENVKDYFA